MTLHYQGHQPWGGLYLMSHIVIRESFSAGGKRISCGGVQRFLIWGGKKCETKTVTISLNNPNYLNATGIYFGIFCLYSHVERKKKQ